MAKVTTLDLTVGQVEQIEKDLGVPANRWGSEAPSIADLYARILGAANGDGPERYKAMKLRELLALVSLDEDEADPT